MGAVYRTLGQSDEIWCGARRGHAGILQQQQHLQNEKSGALKLREDGLELRRMYADKAKPAALQTRKEQMLGEIYRMLALTLGTPRLNLRTRKDSKGMWVSTRKYTRQWSFTKEFAGNDLKNDYVMLMNDPTREYYKPYEIDYDRHTYDGENWTYINLPAEDIKKMAIESIKDNAMMYFSCDVNKFFDRERGVLDTDNFDYSSLMGVDFGMNKADRIRTHASASSHLMTLVAVDLDAEGKPQKWMVENSWGNGANDGHLIITDKWFDEYMFRLVVNRKYIPADILAIARQAPIMLCRHGIPCSHPMNKEREASAYYKWKPCFHHTHPPSATR